MVFGIKDETTIPLNEQKFAKETLVTFHKGSACSRDSDLTVFCFESDHVKVEGELAAFDLQAGGGLKDLIEANEFKGAVGTSFSSLATGVAAKRIAVLGLGKLDTPHAAHHAKIGAALAALCKASKAKTVCVQGEFSANGSQQIFESLFLGLLPDNRFKSAEKAAKLPPLHELHVFSKEDTHHKELEAALARARSVAVGVQFAKDLVFAPPNVCTTVSLAHAAVSMAKELGLEGKVLSPEECEKLGMGSYLAVARGSQHPAQFIHLTYKGAGEIKRRIAVVGKGVTFDTGGYNVKVAGGMMELMKFDMGGAGATFGAAKAIALMKPANVEVHFISPAAENMISANAYRPGDVITAGNGKTIEVNNTDAEGRLCLCDALVYAEKLGVDTIVDIATLTGACIIALGNKYAAYYATSDDLAKSIDEAAKHSGENVWRMPLIADYADGLKSHCADLQNTPAHRNGGSITAALFLQEFVTNKVAWAHIDMAGPAWDWKEQCATGFGVRTLTELIMSAAK
eukprot:GDKI01049823.1.p2 GENE.GDKI01049823.1~~GDKI01049823.1.p2  ORF type:complete len:525 (-),score=201.39 GDKI01049823.1:259-1800(-)